MISPAQILAVDDAPDNLLLLETLLEDLEEYELTCVNSGQAALDVVEKNPPDLVLLDVMMPEMDGYEVTRRIRDHSALPFIPILLLTAHQQSNVVTGLDAGADDFIRKPFQIDELMARIRALLRLKRSIDEQQKMIRERDDFVARMTHDLRTPLVAATRMMQFCLKGSFGQSLADISPTLQEMIKNNNNLLNMVNTLLEVYRHDAGRKQLTLSRVDLFQLCEEVAQALRSLADEKQLELRIHADEPHESYQVRGDRLELHRVVTNLIGNAIKFTNKGSVTLHLICHAPDQVVIEVQDTGSGINPEEQETIFERFRQGTHVNAGSGLGLHLAQRIITLHQGTIRVRSQVGQGSTFIITLPSQ